MRPLRGAWLLQIVLLAVVAIASSQQSMAQEVEKSVLPKHHVLGPIRVFYAVDGKSAISTADKDSSGVPDQVEDVAKQIWAAHRLFCGVLDFPDPFQSQRYPGVNCIQGVFGSALKSAAATVKRLRALNGHGPFPKANPTTEPSSFQWAVTSRGRRTSLLRTKRFT